MTAYLFTLHLLHLALPAAVLAGWMVLLACWMLGGPGRQAWAGWRGRWLWTFLLNLAVAGAGLALFGVDGKMATYGALVLASSLAQWAMWRAWRV